MLNLITRIAHRAQFDADFKRSAVLSSAIITYPVVLGWLNASLYGGNIPFSSLGAYAELLAVLLVFILTCLLGLGGALVNSSVVVLIASFIYYVYAIMFSGEDYFLNYIIGSGIIDVEWIYVNNSIHMSCLLFSILISVFYNIVYNRKIADSLRLFVVAYVMLFLLEILGHMLLLQGIVVVSVVVLPMKYIPIPTKEHKGPHGVFVLLYMLLVPLTFIYLSKQCVVCDVLHMVYYFPFIYPITIFIVYKVASRFHAGSGVKSLLWAFFVSTGICVLLISNTSVVYGLFDFGKYVSQRNYSEYRLAFAIQFILVTVLLYRYTYPSLLKGDGRLVLLRKFGKTKENEHLWKSLLNKRLRKIKVVTLDDGNFQSHNNSLKLYAITFAMTIGLIVLFYNNIHHFVLPDYRPDNPVARFLFGSLAQGLGSAISVIASDIAEYFLGGFVVFIMALTISGIMSGAILLLRKKTNILRHKQAESYINKHLTKGAVSILPKISVVRVKDELWKSFVSSTQVMNMPTLIDVSVITSNMEWELGQINSFNSENTIVTCNVHLFNAMEEGVRNRLVNEFRNIIFYSPYDKTSLLSCEIEKRLF